MVKWLSTLLQLKLAVLYCKFNYMWLMYFMLGSHVARAIPGQIRLHCRHFGKLRLVQKVGEEQGKAVKFFVCYDWLVFVHYLCLIVNYVIIEHFPSTGVNQCWSIVWN